jgi:hypothetical protein
VNVQIKFTIDASFEECDKAGRFPAIAVAAKKFVGKGLEAYTRV